MVRQLCHRWSGVCGLALLLVAAVAVPGRAQMLCDADNLVVDPQNPKFLTGDTIFLLNQSGMNCYAWQMFIAMMARPGSRTPGLPDSCT